MPFKLPGLATLRRVVMAPVRLLSPIIKVPETLIMDALKNAALKALSSLLKGSLAALIATLSTMSFEKTNDPVVVAVIAGITAAMHALISFLKRLNEYDPSKAA